MALALFALALADGPGGAPAATGDRLSACPRPREATSANGHTRSVRCGAGTDGAALRGPARVLFGLGIDPNRADPATLEALPGIGPARAAAIVAGRADGPYRAPADLLRVSGIGPVTLRRAADWLVFPTSERGGREVGGPTRASGASREDAP